MDKSTLQVSCLNLYKKRKTTIAKQLHDHPGKIALTLQVWSNQQMFYFLKVTARYINLNWKLINRTLAFKSLSDPLDENVIVDCITSVLEDWGIGNKVCHPHSLLLNILQFYRFMLYYEKKKKKMCGIRFWLLVWCHHD